MSMGVKCAAQQCHHAFTPDSFTGGQVDTAEMPSGMHPQQFLGQRKNAEMSFHTYPRGANHHTQKCYVRCAPDIFIWAERNSMRTTPQGKGHYDGAEMLVHTYPSQPVTGGHHLGAAMPYIRRPHRIWVIVRSPNNQRPYNHRSNARDDAPRN